MRPIAFVLGLFAVVAAGPVARADAHLIVERGFVPVAGETVPDPERAEVWVSGDRVRLDGTANTFVARFDRGELIVIDHVGRTFSRLPLPVRLENLVPPEQAARIRAELEQRPVEIDVEDTGETREVDGRTARRHVARIRDPRGLSIVNEMWVTRAFDGRYEPYERLQVQLAAMQPGGGWMERLTEVPGLAVVQDIRMSVLDRRQHRTERVIVADDVPVPDPGYDPPEGYEERPFDLMETVRGGS